MTDTVDRAILEVSAVTTGIDEADAQVSKLGTTFTATETKLRGYGTNLEAVVAKIDPVTRANMALEAGQSRLNAAYESSIAKGMDAAKANDLLATGLTALTQKHEAALTRAAALSAGFGAVGSAAGALGADLAGLGTAHDGAGLKANQMREAMVLVHEMLSGNYRRAVGSATIELQNFGLMQPIVGALISPLGLTIGALAAVTVGLTAAFAMHSSSVQEVTDAYKLSGGAIGVGKSQLEEFAHAMADTGAVSVREARSIEAAVMTAGQVPAAALQTIADMAKDYAKVFTDGDLTKAAEDLAKAYLDPTKSAKELDDQLNILTASQLRQIEAMQGAGDKLGAFNVLQAALRDRIGETAKDVGYLEAAFRGMANAVSNAWDAVGSWGKKGTLQQQLDTLKAQSSSQSVDAAGNAYDNAPDKATLDKIANLQKLVDAEKAVAEADGEMQRQQLATKNAMDIAVSLDPQIAALDKMKGQLASLKAVQDNTYGAAPEQIKQIEDAQAGLTSAVNSYATAGQKALQMAQAQAAASSMQTDQAQIYLAVRQKQISLEGQALPQSEKDLQMQAARIQVQAQLSKQMNDAVAMAEQQAKANTDLANAAGQGDAATRKVAEAHAMEAAALRGAAALAAERIKQRNEEADAITHYTNETVSGLAKATQASTDMANAILAGHSAVVQAKADAYERAAVEKLGTEALITGTQAYKDRMAIMSAYNANQAANDNAAGASVLRSQQDRIALMQREIDLQGMAKEARDAELAQLQAMNDIESGRVTVGQDQVQTYINQQGQVAILSDKLDAIRKQEQQSEAINKQVAKDLTTYMSDALDKVMTSTGSKWSALWETMKAMALKTLSEIAAAAAVKTVIMPALVDVLGTVGSAVGVSSSSSATSTTSSSPSGGSLGAATAGSGAGGVMTMLSAGSIGAQLSGIGTGISTAIDGYGAAYLGLANSAGVGEFGPTLTANTGLLGSTTLSQALPFIGAGISAILDFTQGNVGGGVGTLGGAAIGTMIAPGIGTAIGALLGGIIGGMFGGGAPQNASGGKLSNLNSSGQLVITGNSPGENGGSTSGGAAMATTFNLATNEMLQAYGLTLPTGFNTNFMTSSKYGDWYAGFSGGAGDPGYGTGYKKNPTDVINSMMSGMIKDNILKSSDPLMATALKNSTATSYQDLANDLDFVKSLEATAAAAKGATDQLGNLRQSAQDAVTNGLSTLTTAMQKAATLGLSQQWTAAQAQTIRNQLNMVAPQTAPTQTAQTLANIQGTIDGLKQLNDALNLGISATEFTKALTNATDQVRIQYNQGIQNQIQAIEDPFAAAMTQLATDANMMRSEATSAGADMVAVEQLINDKRMALLQQQATTLQNWMTNQALGSTSSLSPSAKLSLAQSNFATALSAAQHSPDQTAVQNLTSAADALLQAGQAMYASSANYASLEQMTRTTLTQFAKGVGLPGFAAGGEFGGGVRIVGEHGPELEFTGPSRILSHEHSKALLAGGGGDHQTAAEVRALRQQVAQLQQALVAVTAQSGVAIRDAVMQGVQYQGDAARAAGRLAAAPGAAKVARR